MATDLSFLEFAPETGDQEDDSTTVFDDFVRDLANKKLRRYLEIIQYSSSKDGGKSGQSVYGHILDLVSIAEKLRLLVGLSAVEMRCLVLALIVHDLNKVEEYGQKDGRDVRYPDAANQKNIEKELEQLGADEFFPEWRNYLADIVFLAHGHQEALTKTTLSFDRRKIPNYKLEYARLDGPLKFLMKAADAADNSHSGDYRDEHEVKLRDKLLSHINAATQQGPRQYRFMGHRLAELRGLFTNVIHRVLVDYFREKFGPEACLDLLYYPEGVNYLLDRQQALGWDTAALQEVTARVEKKLALIQLQDLYKFIGFKNSGLMVDDAAISSGASLQEIFEVITDRVFAKQYKSAFHDEKDADLREDLNKALVNPKLQPAVKERIRTLLELSSLVPETQEALRLGEFAWAYTNFLTRHRADQLKTLKQGSWSRFYHLFSLPEENYLVYEAVHTFRRGYFIARDLPALDLDEMKERALADLADLEEQAASAKNSAKAKKGKPGQLSFLEDETANDEMTAAPLQPGFVLDYLRRNLVIWDTLAENGALSRPVMLPSFGDSLRQYANTRRTHEQCCHCGSPLKAEEWMSAQVPPSFGVQSFSNRLEGGSQRDPKRNVCPICRAQYILEKLAWRSHRDKQGMEQLTFYLHLFPYAFFTEPLLQAWWESIQNLRDADKSAFLISTRNYFSELDSLRADIRIGGYKTGVNGLGLPTLKETMSNTPVLPIVAPGENYGAQFMLALEMAVILTRWFECRAILSRSAVPPVNLSEIRIGNEPVVLMVESMPANMRWLLPDNSLIRKERAGLNQPGVEELFEKLSLLHRLAQKLYYSGDKHNSDLPHDFAAAAADDPLTLYFEANRVIEKKIDAEKGRAKGTPEQQAIYLSAQVAPLLKALIRQEV